MNLNKLKILKGDASFRTFYRNIYKKKSSIIVYSKKEKKFNLLIYDAVNKILNKNDIKSPNLISENYKKNFIQIEDFGNTTVYKSLLRSKNKKILYFKKIIKLLCKLQKIKTKSVKAFDNTTYKIPIYSKKKLLNESMLFIEWYLPEFFKGKNKKLLKKKLIKIFKNLLNNLKYKKKIFVHRDFHVSNIMITKNGFGLIDSQDAVYGNIAYDLASFIDDVRFYTNNNEKNDILKIFLRKNKFLNKKNFKNDFDILSVLRNLKIIGIFTRLSKRDKKNKYLKLIPHAWKLIENRMNNNKKFKDLKTILDKNFPIDIRKNAN